MTLKCIKLSLLGLVVLFISSQVRAQSSIPNKLGQYVEDFHLFDFDSKKFATKNVEKNIIVLFFIGNTCNNTNLITQQMKDLYVKYNTNVEFWAVNSNNPNFSPDDSEEKMKEYSKANNLPYPYLVDLGQIIAAEFGIKQYPMAVILKRESGRLRFVYKGIIYEGSAVTKQNIIDKNISNLLNGKAVQNSNGTQRLCDLL
jgi:peroxiredoxin